MYLHTENPSLRGHRREPFIQNVRFGADKGSQKGPTKNISASGVFIATEERLAVGQQLKRSLPLKKGKSAVVKGQIVWKNEEGFGLKFESIK